MASTAPPYQLHANASEGSLRAPTLPPYSEHAGATPEGEDIELASLSPSTSASSSSSSSSATTPATDSGPRSSSYHRHQQHVTAAPFTPTKQLQIQTAGKNLISFPTPQRPDPIPVFALTPDGRPDRPLYLSVRPDARSGSCLLTHADDEAQAPLSTTTYRFGPGRPPVVVLGDPAQHGGLAAGEGGGEGEGEGSPAGFEITGRSLFSRAVDFHVAGLGSFGWRYGSAAERAEAGADSLLVCEIFLPEEEQEQGHASSSSSSSSSSQQKASVGARLGFRKHDGAAETMTTRTRTRTRTRRVAQLVRNAALRTPGTSRTTAGNGGRLMLDLRALGEKRRERAEWLVVTTAVAMLKREVDRRRAQQIAAIGAIVS